MSSQPPMGFGPGNIDCDDVLTELGIGVGVTACLFDLDGALTQTPWSSRLPQLDPIALRIGDPAESTDTLHLVRLSSHVRSLGA